MKKLAQLTPAQKKANARNQLFRQIHGYNLIPFINRANNVEAITDEEDILLREIIQRLTILKSYQFENSKKLDYILVEDAIVVMVLLVGKLLYSDENNIVVINIKNKLKEIINKIIKVNGW